MTEWALTAVSCSEKDYGHDKEMNFTFRLPTGESWRQSLTVWAGAPVLDLVNGLRELADSIEKKCLPVGEDKDAKTLKP